MRMMASAPERALLADVAAAEGTKRAVTEHVADLLRARLAHAFVHEAKEKMPAGLAAKCPLGASALGNRQRMLAKKKVQVEPAEVAFASFRASHEQSCPGNVKNAAYVADVVAGKTVMRAPSSKRPLGGAAFAASASKKKKTQEKAASSSSVPVDADEVDFD